MIETTNKTQFYGILGTPISHTLSPAMHSYIANKEGIDMAYLPFDVRPEALSDAMRGLKTIGAKGFNITAPHKIDIMQHLDVVSEDAERMHSVNTIVNRNGIWHGFNTDGDGFCESLILEGHQIKGSNILLMGAGGAARSLCYTLAKNGAKSIAVTSRSMNKVRIIGDMVETYTDTAFSDMLDKQGQYDIVINTTPMGMHPYEGENPCGFMEKIDADTVCCDLIYRPQKTVFLQEAEAKGAPIVNGLGMLVLQGILAFEHFHEITLDRTKYYKELMDLFHLYRI